MNQFIDLPQGRIHYVEYGTAGEPVVFVHGFAVDGQLWEPVAERLAAAGMHCIVPTWPFGSHRTPMHPDADLAPPAAARIILDFIAALNLEGVTIVGNDSGGAVTQMVVTTDASRIGRLVLTNCDAFENFPPGMFKLMSKLGVVPGFGFMLAQAIGVLKRWSASARSSRRPIPTWSKWPSGASRRMQCAAFRCGSMTGSSAPERRTRTP